MADIISSVVSRLSKESDSSSLTSSICRRGKSKIGGRKPSIRNRSKVQRIVGELVKCKSPNQQFLTMKEELRNHDLRQINELISSSTSNSSSNTLNRYPLLFYPMTQCKTSTSRAQRTLTSKVDIYGKVDPNAFCKSSKRIKSKLLATNSIIESE